MEILCLLKMYSLWKKWVIFSLPSEFTGANLLTVSSSPSILSPCVNLSTNTTVDPHLQRHTTGPRKKQRERDESSPIPTISSRKTERQWRSMFADHDRLPNTLSLIISKAWCVFVGHRPDVYLPSRLAWWLEIFFKLIPFTWKGLLLGISLKYSPNTKPKPSTNSSRFVCSWIKFCYA